MGEEHQNALFQMEVQILAKTPYTDVTFVCRLYITSDHTHESLRRTA